MTLDWKETLRGIMKTAWVLLRKGLANLIMSLKVAWRIYRKQTTMAQVEKQLRAKR